MRRVCLTGVLCAAWMAAARAEDAAIYRDQYGVPSVFAASPRAASYGLGYAMAEDRLEDIYRNVRTAIGRSAEVDGPDAYEIDLAMHLVRNAEVSKAGWEGARPEIKEITEAYIAGVKAYIATNPDRGKELALDLEPWQCLAVGRAMVFRWPLENIMEELGRRGDGPPPFSSNAFAVAPGRSADRSAILLTDPHLTWEGMAVFFEARVHGGPDYEMNGFFIAGSPVVGLGHNGHMGWAMTTGGPDTSDVYALKLVPGLLPTQYTVDGQVKQGTMRLISIAVKGEAAPRQQPTLDTEYGPVVELDAEKGVAYAASTPYIEDTGMLEQSYRMVRARTAGEFLEAIAVNSLMEQNLMFAGRDGNIGYVRVGRTPKRPEGFDWTRPVPADTSKSKYLGIHDLKEHVQILNPPSGYMQNCNVSPANMFADSPLTHEKYVPYLYNVSWDKNNPRGKRLVHLLDADRVVSREEAMGYALDVYDILAEPWKKAVVDAANFQGGDLIGSSLWYAAAVSEIGTWNGMFTKESKGAPLMWRLRTHLADQIDVQAIADGKPLGEEDQKKLVQGLAEVVDGMVAAYPNFPPAWGDIHVVGRGGKYYPSDGADFGRGAIFTETVRDVEYRDADEPKGKRVAYSGSMAAMIMFFKRDGVDAYTATPWGQSGDPASPHYTDQAEKVHAPRKFKASPWTLEQAKAGAASEKVLSVP